MVCSGEYQRYAKCRSMLSKLHYEASPRGEYCSFSWETVELASERATMQIGTEEWVGG